MPRYEYSCNKCDAIIVVSHLSDEKETDCPKCLTKGSLSKRLTNFMNLSKKTVTRNKVGDITEEFIQSSREELNKQKKERQEER